MLKHVEMQSNELRSAASAPLSPLGGKKEKRAASEDFFVEIL